MQKGLELTPPNARSPLIPRSVGVMSLRALIVVHVVNGVARDLRVDLAADRKTKTQEKSDRVVEKYVRQRPKRRREAMTYEYITE